jgi:acetylornithine/succinyldiaminopimelate/putrescine aminotransferase
MSSGTVETTATSDIQAREARHVLQTYRRFPVAFVRGEGVRLFDAEGRSYLDLLSGIGVAALGNGSSRIADAIGAQARELAHTSNLFFHPLQGQLADRLTVASGLGRAFFCNSGSEANEACLKFARRYWYSQGVTTRTGLVALEHSFHGRTMGSLSVTWDPHYRDPFEPLVPGVTFVNLCDGFFQGQRHTLFPVFFIAPLGTGCFRSVQEDLQVGIGKDLRADISPLHHHRPGCSHFLLGMNQYLPYLGKA